ncbi:MAG: putative HTH-type transcriptional regulator YdfH [Syntrophorhabdaceae bacterium PtaU1.Bin034]|nr:MAG: putative HTH-type transcriptional regulator YdfH [Syntrophorhabdaceae bacterium PtaU1.Bin034]
MNQNKGSSENRKRKKKRLLREQVYNGIKDSIISGEFEPGRRLIEEKLAEDMKTSRTPVREAIQKLEKEGLIYRLPRGGFAVKGVSEEEVEEVFNLRSLLEGYAANLASTRIQEHEIKALEDIVNMQEALLQNMNADEFIRLDGEFHDTLYKAARNNRLYALLGDLRDYMYRYRVIILRFGRKDRYAVQDHKEMLDSIKAKNGREVEKLVKKHISRGKDLIKKKIRQGQEPRI